MNLPYFSQQRDLAKLRIDAQKGTMKGYLKASELKAHYGQGEKLSSQTTPTTNQSLSDHNTHPSSKRCGRGRALGDGPASFSLSSYLEELGLTYLG